MNKEALRKELEDAIKWASYGQGIANSDTYITTRLAALDDGDDGVSGKDFAKWIEENCEVIREPGITLYRYNDYRHGEGVGNYTLDDIYTTYKDIIRVDDGQEGKGLPKFLVIKDDNGTFEIWDKNRYETYVRKATDYGATPAVRIVTGFNGNEDFLFPALPVADAEGEKVGLEELPFDKEKFYEMEQEIQKHMDQFDLEQRIKAGKAIEDLRSIYITV